MQDLDLLHHFVTVASPDTLQDGDQIRITQEVPRMAFEVSPGWVVGHILH